MISNRYRGSEGYTSSQKHIDTEAKNINRDKLTSAKKRADKYQWEHTKTT